MISLFIGIFYGWIRLWLDSKKVWLIEFGIGIDLDWGNSNTYTIEKDMFLGESALIDTTLKFGCQPHFWLFFLQ